MKIVSRVLFFDFKAFLIKTFYYIRIRVLPLLRGHLRSLGFWDRLGEKWVGVHGVARGSPWAMGDWVFLRQEVFVLP